MPRGVSGRGLPGYRLPDGSLPRAGGVSSSSPCPVMENTMRSQMFPTRSATRSRLWATQVSRVAWSMAFGIGHDVGDQLTVDLLVQRVHLRVFLGDGTGRLDVLAEERLQGAVQHVAGLGGHAGDVDQGLDEPLGADHHGDVRDSLGVVGHALQLRGDLQDGRQRPQVTRHGLLGGDERQGLVLDRVALLVDVPVRLDDAARVVDVLVLQGLHRLRDGTLGHGAQLQYLVLQTVQVVLELFPRHSFLLGPVPGAHPNRPVI